jgi:hypothetical protein
MLVAPNNGRRVIGRLEGALKGRLAGHQRNALIGQNET